jgi:hypothetical protein
LHRCCLRRSASSESSFLLQCIEIHLSPVLDSSLHSIRMRVSGHRI